MLEPVLIGVLAAIVSALPALVRASNPGIDWSSPLLVLGIAGVAIGASLLYFRRSRDSADYEGIPDFLIHIHSPASPDSAKRWGIRAAISFLLSLCGGIAGPEGAATEAAHAVSIQKRQRFSRWFEQHLRTDAGKAIAGAVAAVFQAPFGAILMTMELGIGGRGISVALTSISSFLVTKFLLGLKILPQVTQAHLFSGFNGADTTHWLAILLISLAIGLISSSTIWFLSYSRESLQELFKKKLELKVAFAAVGILAVIFVYKSGHVPSPELLDSVLSAERTPAQAGLIALTSLIVLSLVVAGFGTAGVLWPLFAIGGYFGFAATAQVFVGHPGLASIAGLAGACSLLGAVLGTPISAAVIAFELSDEAGVLLPCLLSAIIANQIRRRLCPRPWVDLSAERRGLRLLDGRSASVLEAIPVKDAMVKDIETVSEHEPIAELYEKLLSSRYPFLPVIDAKSKYVGLITVDMVQDVREKQALSAQSPLSKLLEAKDLLYRSGSKTPTVQADDRLSATAGLFGRLPCIVELDPKGSVAGLLLSSHVRFVYDREVARGALLTRQ